MLGLLKKSVFTFKDSTNKLVVDISMVTADWFMRVIFLLS